MASTLISIAISLVLGAIVYLSTINLILDNISKMMIIMVIMIAAYTLANEGLQSQHID